VGPTPTTAEATIRPARGNRKLFDGLNRASIQQAMAHLAHLGLVDLGFYMRPTARTLTRGLCFVAFLKGSHQPPGTLVRPLGVADMMDGAAMQTALAVTADGKDDHGSAFDFGEDDDGGLCGGALRAGTWEGTGQGQGLPGVRRRPSMTLA
jgi:hypothetical protein